MNKDKLKALCHKLSKESGLPFNMIQTHYFLERILEQISSSSECENFIFKGGFLLSNVIGIRQRSTLDIDFVIRQFPLTEEVLLVKFQSILLNSSSDIKYSIQRIEPIRESDEYGGYRLTILCQLENIRQVIPLDIATGDPITPEAIRYSYKSIFDESEFNICAYNVETMLAEKLQTICERGVFNSRCKDFYDVFMIYSTLNDSIDYKLLHAACVKTFAYRNTSFNKETFEDVLMMLRNDDDLHSSWLRYQKSSPYAVEITFDKTLDVFEQIIDCMGL